MVTNIFVSKRNSTVLTPVRISSLSTARKVASALDGEILIPRKLKKVS